MPRVVEWSEFPQMDTGAPMPSIERAGDSLVVAYIRSSTTRPDSSAVVCFRGVSWVHFGSPSDERLSDHPLYQFGLNFYAFWEVLDSPKIPTGSSQRHWIATFHDETLEVVADTASVRTQSVQGTATREIARQYV
jgi:hypothetical protein